MHILLQIINEEKIVRVPYQDLGNDANPKKRKIISEADVALLEKLYQRMSREHQTLFDCICRDPVTGVVMDDPVLLPDGYVYDRTTALFYLEILGECPLNPAVSFKLEDITRCQFVYSVLDELKSQIEEVKLSLKALEPAKQALFQSAPAKTEEALKHDAVLQAGKSL
jgi:hypothetical protein